MGRSRGGLTTKIHALVDANGLPIAHKLTAGQGARRTFARLQIGLPAIQIRLIAAAADESILPPLGKVEMLGASP